MRGYAQEWVVVVAVSIGAARSSGIGIPAEYVRGIDDCYLFNR